MQSDEVKRHIRKVRKQYHSRRDFTVNEFKRVFNQKVSFNIPAGGLALWVNLSKIITSQYIKNYD